MMNRVAIVFNKIQKSFTTPILMGHKHMYMLLFKASLQEVIESELEGSGLYCLKKKKYYNVAIPNI